jgi:hypothetical protein
MAGFSYPGGVGDLPLRRAHAWCHRHSRPEQQHAGFDWLREKLSPQDDAASPPVSLIRNADEASTPTPSARADPQILDIIAMGGAAEWVDLRIDRGT